MYNGRTVVGQSGSSYLVNSKMESVVLYLA